MRDKRHINNIVRQVLEEDVPSRSSDRRLYVLVCAKISPTVLQQNMAAGYLNPLAPSTETVRRSRQLLQRKYEHLRADDNVEGMRLIEEESYREFVKDVR